MNDNDDEYDINVMRSIQYKHGVVIHYKRLCVVNIGNDDDDDGDGDATKRDIGLTVNINGGSGGDAKNRDIGLNIDIHGGRGGDDKDLKCMKIYYLSTISIMVSNLTEAQNEKKRINLRG